MIFLVLLTAIGVYKLLGWHAENKHDQWFFSLGDKLTAALRGMPRLIMLLTLLVPLVVIALFLRVTEDWLFGFFGLFCQVLILFYAL